ncbi:MAG: hypothetical protein GY808_01005 [Gammaproteobacteria bacterium]|nr:hypothetical protein [Gammaproteobacteria bacterium]
MWRQCMRKAATTTGRQVQFVTERGQEKVNAQWQMYCLVHNMEKLRNTLH